VYKPVAICNTQIFTKNFTQIYSHKGEEARRIAINLLTARFYYISSLILNEKNMKEKLSLLTNYNLFAPQLRARYSG
jgi:hypothetical protein